MVRMAKAFDRERRYFREGIGDSPHPEAEAMLVSGTEKRRDWLSEEVEQYEDMLRTMPKSPSKENLRGMADGCKYGLRYILKRKY